MTEPVALPAPPDVHDRRRITDELGATLFVEAGAGSGKTTALVERVLALVAEGAVELGQVAAITFTEKAGAELRDRIRQGLEGRLECTGDPIGADRYRAALDQLDAAAIGTLHAFAQRILAEHPVEAGLPPRVEVLDEVTSGIEFERRWTAQLDRLLADPALERTLLLLFASGVRETALRALAVAFEANWDLVEERVAADPPEPPAVATLLEPALAALDRVCGHRAHCADGGDGLCQRLDAIADYARRLRAAADEIDLVEVLCSDGPAKPPSFKVARTGQKPRWSRPIDDIRADVQAAGETLEAVRGELAEACAHRVAAALRHDTLRAAAERRAAGRLDFHDLLVLARSLLRHPVHGARVRARLGRTYRRLLLDELQDTDPIQIELAVRIAAADPAGEAAGRAPWSEVAVAPGGLFMVGDPKQSIYRFRRADIATFLEAESRFGPEGGGVVSLTANFRTVAPVVEWVNHTLGALMAEAPAQSDLPSQPRYVALDAVRPDPPDGPPVAVLGRLDHDADISADGLRSAEAAEVAAAVARVVTEGWAVGDGAGGWRPARLGDIAILVPARTSLPFLEDALEAAGVPFRAEASSLVYASRAVRDLLMVLRAVADPTDHLRIVAALRTPLLGCGDDDLFRFRRQRGGSWSYLARQPAGVPPDDPVRAGLDVLRQLHEQRHWRSPSELLERIARDCRAFELGFAERRPRDTWRRLRFVIDQARAWTDATGGTLRHYLVWVDQQSAEGARVAEAVLPETDDEAVRIMTIHAAKGLEFPVTVLSGLTTVPQARRAPAEVAFPAGSETVGYRFGRHVLTQEFERWLPIDEQMGYDERIRLLYVACTRARDHLVVSLHRRQRARPPEAIRRTNAELLVAGMGTLLDELPDALPEVEEGEDDVAAPGRATARPARLGPPPPAPPQPFDEWAAERRAALERSARPIAVAATALTNGDRPGDPDGLAPGGLGPGGLETSGSLELGDGRRVDAGLADGAPSDPGLAKRPRDLDLPPWLKGRYGTSVGRAVHGVLQIVDLRTGAGLDAAAAAQCEAEAIPDRVDEVRALARAALDAPSVREAAAGPHWREVYVCAPVDGDRLVEGYVDLLYRSADGLVVVDHKTAASADPADLDQRVEGYRAQGAAYALAVAVTTGEPVVRVTFLFLTPDGPVERHLEDTERAVAEVRELVGAGREVVLA